MPEAEKNRINLAEVAARLRLLGVSPYLCDKGSLWFGRVCLHPDGTASLDGRADREAGEVGQALDGLAAALHRVAQVPDWHDIPVPWRAGPPRLQGRRAQAETARFLEVAEGAHLPVQRISTGKWVVADRVLYIPATGRMRVLPHGRVLERRGLEALGDLLRAELGDEHP